MRPTSFASLLVLTAPVLAADLQVQMASLDQPRINAYVSRTPDGTPLTADIFGVETFNIQAFYDTGASGILISNETAAEDFGLGIQEQTVNGQPVIYSDVGVAGADNFYVSEQLYFHLGAFNDYRDLDNPASYQQVYNQTFASPMRAQLGPIVTGEPDPLLGGLDVFGMPLFTSKVVVMDNRGVNTFQDTIRTYVYDPGTAYNPKQLDLEPGIVPTNRSIRLSYVSFDRFTTTTPGGAPPTLRNNPFIGPNPFNDPKGRRDTTPPVTMRQGNKTARGSFLLDTGAAASIISRAIAEGLGVTYVEGTYGTEDPVLAGVDPDLQFKLRIGGIGGTILLAGFYMDSMLVKTEQGDAYDDKDPNHLRFLYAPVLVGDISLLDPLTNTPFTLDGIFGMNFLTASAYFEDAFPIPIIDDLTQSPFDWVVMDDATQRLRLSLNPAFATVPEPATAMIVMLGGTLLARRRRLVSRGPAA
jgi:hypothetical protein